MMRARGFGTRLRMQGSTAQWRSLATICTTSADPFPPALWPSHGDSFPSEPACGIPDWATINPWTLSGSNPGRCQNLVAGVWKNAAADEVIVDPLNGEPFLLVPDTSAQECKEFVDSAARVPKHGVFNPLKNPEKYVEWGRILHNAGHELSRPEVMDFFAKSIARVMPKSYYQAWYETKVTADFLKNFGGDNPRFNCSGEHVSGDHTGQESKGYRWPYGPVCIVSPFNFPLEIPVLQLMGALMMGNKPTFKASSNVALVMDQYIRMLIASGMPAEDMDFINTTGPTMSKLIAEAPFRVTQFTGSCEVAETLAAQTHGKVKIEDAGFDWKIFGGDVPSDPADREFIAWTSDQDAFACSGQKCSAQSIAFVHENWLNDDFNLIERMAELASRRKLDDLSIGPVLTHTTQSIMEHKDRILQIPGSYTAFGGNELQNHSVPPQYGMVEPTAVYVPITELLKDEHFDTCTKELFGPFQVLTTYTDEQEHMVLEACERIPHHLTAAVVSNDPRFQTRILGSTVNGTTYCGYRARTTGAPQNHWFGPAGDPRGAGIGSPYAIQLCWSTHREIVHDHGEIPPHWSLPKPS